MELDNLIYIIITLAIFVLSIFGQFRKKKVHQPLQTEEIKYSLNDFEKILDRKEEYINKDEVKLDVVDLQVTENQILSAVKIDEKKSQPEQKELEKESEINDGFDIKSAIIYSSILERKKFRH